MPTQVTIDAVPPVPSAQAIDKEGHFISQPWQDWFLKLRTKLNTINANLVGWSNVPIATGITPGIYGDTSHYPIITVDVTGRITNVTLQSVSGGSGGILPVVTSEVVSGQPVFVILDDGSLVYVPVT